MSVQEKVHMSVEEHDLAGTQSPAEKGPQQGPSWQPFAAGLGLTILIGGAATLIAPLPILAVMGSLTVALLIGLLWRNTAGLPVMYRGGVKFSSQRLLRYGIILTGIRLNFNLIASSGLKVLLLDAVLIVFGVLVIPWLTRRLGFSPRLAFLMGVGQAICGASAVGAMEVLYPAKDSKEDEGPLAVAICGLVGTVGVLFFTFGMQLFHWPATFYGMLAGSTLHEIAQVLAAGPAGGKVAADLATVTKLTRVVFLAPVAIVVASVMSYRTAKQSGGTQGQTFNWKSIPVPWFVFGFLLVGALNSLGLFSAIVANGILQISTFLMVAAMAGMGLMVDIAVIRKTGLRALGISVLTLALFIAVSSLLISMLGNVL